MTANGKRIAIVFRGIGDIGGTNNTIADHARHLRALGYGVDLIGEKVNKGGVTADMGRPVKVSRLSLLKHHKWRWFAARAQRTINAGGYHFVAGHGHHYRQHVLSMHNCLHLAHEQVYGRALHARGGLVEIHDQILAERSFEFCICNSRLMRDDLARRYGIDEQRLPVIYPGYRLAQFNVEDRARYRSSVREELACGTAVLIGLVTSADYRKRGLDILLEAYAGLDARLQQQSLLLVLGKQGGSGPFVEAARALGIADRIRFVAHTRVPERYFHALDICAHPARIEEFGQSVQEAMACGVPVVASRRVGATELLPSELRDELPAAPDAANIRAQLATLIASREVRDTRAERARAAVQHNTEQANFEQTLAVYRRAGL